MKCRILIADDHELVRRGINELFKKYEHLEVCGEACDGREAMKKAQLLKPDILITDVGMPRMNGLIACNKILRENPKQKILIFSVFESEMMIRNALAAGIRGLVFKTDPTSDLIEAVEALRQNRMFFSRQVDQLILTGYLEAMDEKSSHLKRGARYAALSVRENEVLQLLAEGNSSKEVALLLDVSTKTAETHRVRLMRKLGIHDLATLVIYAIRQNIVEAPFTDVSVVRKEVFSAAVA